MATENLYPAIRPSLDLNFAGSKTLDPRITFGRASAATYYDGKTVAKAEENLLLSSQLFTSYWQTSNGNISGSGATAPDGTSTAYLVAETAATGPHFLHQLSSYVSGIPYTISIFVKKGSGATAPDIVQITFPIAAFGAGQYANFNITAGVVLTSVGGTPTISGVGAGWYRISFTAVATSTNTTSAIGVVFCNNDDTLGRTPSYAGATTSDVLVWGAQLEQRSQVTAYTPTTTQPITNYIPVLQTAPAGVPRFDHNPVTGESLGLLVEEQRTNFFKQSEDVSQGVWVKQRTGVITGCVSPFGSFAGKLIPSTDLNTHLLSQLFLSSAGTYTLSAYVKAGEYSRFQLYLNDATTGSAGVIVNLAAKTASVTASGSWTNTSVFINELTNGWFRVGVTGTQGAGTGVSCVIAMYDNTQNAVFAGDGFSGIYVTGLQVEAGSFPTSYIKTEASQVTRAADSASMTGANFSSWYRQDEGTLFAEATAFNNGAPTHIDDGTLVNRLYMTVRPAGSTGAAAVVIANNSMQVELLSYTASQYNKLTLAYKANNFAASANNLTPASDSSGYLPQVDRLRLFSNTSNQTTGTIKRISFYPKRLTDAQLQALTA